MPLLLAKVLDDVVQLCPLSSTTRKVTELANSDRASIGAIVSAISLDPALATAVLRVANSALYGGIKVSQLNAAVMRIGMRELKELVAAMSVLATFRANDAVQMALHERSALAGGIANKVAKATKLMPPSSASTCGLLSEIGAMACLAVDSKVYSRLWLETLGDYVNRVAKERERYSVTSFEIGRQFLMRNSLPEEVTNAVGAELNAPDPQWQASQTIALVARHTAAILLESGGDDALCVARLDELTSKVNACGLTGATLHELLLTEGLLRNIPSF
jgi:HD-like signal output (HDOD) protein